MRLGPREENYYYSKLKFPFLRKTHCSRSCFLSSDSLGLPISAPSIIAGVGLLYFKPWARVLTIILSVIHLVQRPVRHCTRHLRPVDAVAAGDGTAIQAGVELPGEVGMFEGLFQPMHLLSFW